MDSSDRVKSRRNVAAGLDGDPNARAGADVVLGIVGSVLGSAAADWYRAAYGEPWQTERGFTVGVGNRARGIVDPSELLGRLRAPSTEFDRVFRPALTGGPGPVHDLARSMVDDRNALVHRLRTWEAVDTLRLADRAIALIASFNIVSDDAIAQLRDIARDSASSFAGDRAGAIDELRTAYLETVTARTAYLDLAGIGARAGTSIVRVRFEDAYVDPTFAAVGAAGSGDVGTRDLIMGRRAILIGGPGSGKSTVLRHIERTLAVGSAADLPKLVPIAVVARELARAIDAEPSLTLRQFLIRRASDRFGALFEEEIALGRAVILVDGLDEVPAAEDRSRVATLCRQFAEDFPDIGLIATSRPVGFPREGGWSSFALFEIQPLSADQIGAFINRWGVLLGNDRDGQIIDPDRLLDAIRTAGEGVHDLASTPLLLTLLVLMWARGASLPEHVAELYDLAVTTLVQEWPRRRGGSQMDRGRMLAVLEPVAFSMVAAGESTIGERALVRSLAAVLQAAGEIDAADASAEFLRLVADRTGFFVETGYAAGERQFGFLHKSFAEYLAALHLAELWDDEALDLDALLHRNRWDETLELFAGHVSARGRAAASRLVSAIESSNPPSERYLGRNLPWLARLMASGVTPRDDVRDGVFRRAVAQVVASAHEPLRTWDAPHVVRLGRLLPRHVADAATRSESDEPAADRARKALLRLSIWPDDDRELEEMIVRIDDLLRGAWDPWQESHRIFESVVPGFSMSFLFPEEAILVVGGLGHAVVSDQADRFERAGVPVTSLSEIAASGLPTGGIWLVRTRPLPVTVDEMLALVEHHPLSLLRQDVLEQQSWHDDRAEEIRSLGNNAADLRAETAVFAHDAIAQLSDGPGLRAWIELAVDIAVEGGEAARLTSLTRFVHAVPYDAGLVALVDAAVAQNMISNRGLALGTGLLGGDTDPALIERVEQIAFDGGDAVAEGLARQALAITARIDDPLSILSSPSVAVPAGARPPGIDDTTGDVIERLLTEAGTVRESAAANIARSIIEVADYRYAELGSGDRIANPSFDAMARVEAASARTDTRLWAALILGCLERPPASDVFAALLVDPDASVREAAVDAIHPEDVGDDRWLEEVLPRFWAAERGEYAEFGSIALANQVRFDRDDEFAALAEAALDSDPGNPGALFFLLHLRRRMPSRYDRAAAP